MRRSTVYCHSTGFSQVFLEFFIMFPNTAVGGIDSTGPVITGIVADRGRYGALQHKCRQCRYFGWKIVIGGSFTTDGGDRENKITYFIFLIDPSTFT